MNSNDGSGERWQPYLTKLNADDLLKPIGSGQDDAAAFLDVPLGGLVLLLKICGALADMEYPQQLVEKVGGLVRRNMMTVVHHQSLSFDTELRTEDPEYFSTRIRALLSTMLDTNNGQSGRVHVNSNEPVLLINVYGRLSHQDLGLVVQETLQQLHKDSNIWPVRVYAGPFLPADVDGASHEQGFTISLLNVVNTDIGGPSMIDLLDHSSTAISWSFTSSGFYRQAWRDRHLIDQVDTGASISRRGSVSSTSNLSEESTDSQFVESSVAAPVAGILKATKSESSMLHDPEEVPEVPSISDVKVVATETTAAGDDAAWQDIRAQYGPQKEGSAIAYPTWEHSGGGESLLDLVRSQAAGIHGTEKREGELDTESQPERPNKQDSGGSDDDFIVV